MEHVRLACMVIEAEKCYDVSFPRHLYDSVWLKDPRIREASGRCRLQFRGRWKDEVSWLKWGDRKQKWVLFLFLDSVKALLDRMMPSHTRAEGNLLYWVHLFKNWSCPETPSKIHSETVFWLWYPRSPLKTCKRNHLSWGADKSLSSLKPFYCMSNEQNMKNFRFS